MNLTGKTVVAVITHDYTRIWTTDMKKGHEPEVVKAQQAVRKAHVREPQHHGGHETSQYDNSYFEKLSFDLLPADQILLVGHGKGKGNSMMQFLDYVNLKHPDLAQKVIGTIDENIQGMTEQQILESARIWFSQWFGAPVEYWQANVR